MDTADLTKRMRDIVVEHLDVEPDKVGLEARFIEHLGADSLDFIELTMAFEEAFDVWLPDDIAADILTFGDAVKAISERLGVAA